MYLYNITLIIEVGQERGVIDQVKTFLSAESALHKTKLLRLLDAQHEGSTYSLQVEAPNMDGVTAFQGEQLQALQAKLEGSFPGKVLYFESVMEYV